MCAGHLNGQSTLYFISGLVLVLAHALVRADEAAPLRASVPRIAEAAALVLALCSLLLGLIPWEGYLPLPDGVASKSLTLEALFATLWPILAGGVLAILFGRWGRRLVGMAWLPKSDVVVAMVAPARRAGLAFGVTLERVDGTLRQWPAASLSLLIVAILFGAAMLTMH
jgi:hypothetical protein